MTIMAEFSTLSLMDPPQNDGAGCLGLTAEISVL